jgi:hypothetical protein
LCSLLFPPSMLSPLTFHFFTVSFVTHTSLFLHLETFLVSWFSFYINMVKFFSLYTNATFILSFQLSQSILAKVCERVNRIFIPQPLLSVFYFPMSTNSLHHICKCFFCMVKN